jgi:ELWxxDGT repeat protein
MVDLDGILIFAANDGEHGRELWRSDGTDEGTMLVKDIDPGTAGDSANSGSPHLFYRVGDGILFYATDEDHGCELWRSDGSEGGTYLVQDINSGLADAVNRSFWVLPPDLPAVVVNDQLYFQADDGNVGYELWKSDGTADGTTLVKDIRPGPESGFSPAYIGGPLYAASFVNADGTLFFRANDGTHGLELWTSDGTTEGTNLVYDINPGEANAVGPLDFPMATVGGTVYLRADDGVHGGELWRSDGTEAGTFLVRDIYPGNGSSLAQATWLTNVGGTLFFSAADPVHGREVWHVVETVSLDIKPGDEPNSVNLRSNGNIPIAVLSTPDFDATTVDTSDLSRIHFGDERLANYVSPEKAKWEDVDHDGDLDLLLFFSTREIREQNALVSDSTMAQLTGFTQSGQFISATDSVRIVPGSSSGKPTSVLASDSPSTATVAMKEKTLTQGQDRRSETGPPQSVIDKKAVDVVLGEDVEEEDLASVLCAGLEILDLLAPI